MRITVFLSLLLLPLIAVSGDILAEVNDAAHSGAVHIPEPMVFDLVRGLDSSQGELEMNVLGLVRRREGHLGVEWAPEIEYAVSDGLAFELELPFEDERLESIKTAGQYTFGYGESYIHGTQVIFVGDIESENIDSSFLYIFGLRISRDFSLLLMTGIGLGPDTFPNVDEESSSGLDFINNASLFYEITDAIKLGLEVNTLRPKRGSGEILLMPQIHTVLSERISLQAGLGSRGGQGASRLEFGSRLIFEF